MPRSGRHGWLSIFGLGLALAGCSAPPAPAYPTWAHSVAEFAPSPDSGNAYDGYVLAARRAEADAAELANFVSFDGRAKRKLRERLSTALGMVRRATAKPCDFKFVPRIPFQQDPNHPGWRLIRLALTWQIEEAVKSANFGAAIDTACMLSRLGFDLSGGSAKDCDLGLQMVDDARKALLPGFAHFDKLQLSRLTNGLKSALRAKPEFEKVIANERQSMLAAVQFVQDCYQKGDLSPLDNNLLNEVRDATTFLRQLKGEKPEKRIAYFSGFADEVDTYCDWARQQSSLPAMRRTDPADPKRGLKFSETRPWRRFSKQFFTTLQPILDKLDATVARTRLLILSSEISRMAKVSGSAPKNLSGFTPDLTVDPYVGQAFRYHPAGMDYKIYSAGSNFQDDQGETDSNFSTPDLTLERI